MLRKIFVLLGIVSFAVLIYFLAGIMAFSGAFDKKYSREGLVKEFTEHEQQYEDVVSFFKDHIPAQLNYSIFFRVGKRKRVTLMLRPFIIAPGNEILGGADLKIDSPELKIALDTLGWTKNIAIELQNRLKKTRCDKIKTAAYRNDLIEMSPYQNGWGSFTYRVFDNPVSDSMTTVTGKPVSSTRFGSRVVLSYSSAL